MKRLFRLLIVSACILALTLSASAAAVKAEKMTVEMTVDENGTAKAEVSAHLTAEAPVDSLSIALGPNVSGVHIAGQKAKVSRSGGQSTVLLGGESGLSFPMDLHLSYTIRNTGTLGGNIVNASPAARRSTRRRTSSPDRGRPASRRTRS